MYYVNVANSVIYSHRVKVIKKRGRPPLLTKDKNKLINNTENGQLNEIAVVKKVARGRPKKIITINNDDTINLENKYVEKKFFF